MEEKVTTNTNGMPLQDEWLTATWTWSSHPRDLKQPSFRGHFESRVRFCLAGLGLPTNIGLLITIHFSLDR